MAKTITLTCDFCGKRMDRAASKLHLSPVPANGMITAPMSSYTHHGDICGECTEKLKRRLKQRQKRAVVKKK